MRNSSELFKQGIMKAYTEQSNVSLNSDTIKDMAKYSQAMEGETTEATGASSAGAFSGPLFSNEEMKEGDKIPGGLAKGKSLKDIAKKHSPKEFEKLVSHLKKEIVKGTKVELEHTSDPKVAFEIAKDHLFEDPDYYNKLKKIEANEATGSGSVGSYETPAFLPKNSKNWRGGKKPIYKGGKFVKVKEKCTKFPYCNQGAGAIKIYENETLESVISSVSKKIGVEEQIIRRILYNNFKKKNKN